ncbi:methyltransferase domain-containing protein [Herminiimonas arsenitoxidans]|uniref:methyltransferase domain-containing protein n=1 Tax=Herminiimonas arsenitoxidans TaxID=1809410 RepID=UPI00097067BC|nr:methyltransferase domain-containing protein [Herminiimonas arsenitoxidans]
MLTERELESCYLGQFIPVHYHHNMLMDNRRMSGFKAAIDHLVAPGAKVLELGGGTGVLSWFAAAKAEKVWCVEYNPDLVVEAKRFLAHNVNGDKVEVIQGDAFEYLPPEPVDVVICEMIHVAMLREKQVQVIESFKQRYLEKFGGPLPIFIPEAMIMAVQPLQQDYCFEGYNAPIVQFQEPTFIQQNSVELAQPSVYSILDFTQPVNAQIAWEGVFAIEHAGTVNALRFVTKNILAVVMQQSTTVDWLNHYLVLPLAEPVAVKAGDQLYVSFVYNAGGSIPSLQASIRANHLHVVEAEWAMQTQHAAAYA